MSEPENFLARWSRRKRAAAEPPAEDAAAPHPVQQDDQKGVETVSVPSDPARQNDALIRNDESEPFDPASLPSIDSIDASTNVAAFLRPGVPQDLTRAALRRAWTSDPAIRDFVGLVENGWDFNSPEAMGGFGTLGAEEIARLASQFIAQLPEPPPAATALGAAKPDQDNSALPSCESVEASGIKAPSEQIEPSAGGENGAAQNKPEA